MNELLMLVGLGVAIFLFRGGGVLTPEEYVRKMNPIAKQVQDKWGIKKEFLITQSALESNYGNSKLTKEANNLFGMKWDKKHNWIELPTTEYDANGKPYKTTARFNRYNSWTESCTDYADKISTFPVYRGVYNQAKIGNLVNWAWELSVSPYATDPNYGDYLIARYKAISKYFEA